MRSMTTTMNYDDDYFLFNLLNLEGIEQAIYEYDNEL